MKKDKAWLKEEVKSLFDEAYDSGKMEYYESEESIHRINSLVDQLDEPETLSQEWIDENKVERINDVRKMTTSDVVPVEKLKNLLVPKQDKPEVEENFYTFDNAKKWLQDDGFVVFEKDKLDEEVQRMIDETYKAMNEEPDWDYDEKEDALVDSTHPTRYSLEANYWKLIDRVRYSYEVEKERLYQVELPTERLHHILTMHGDGKGHFFGKEHTNNFWYRTYLTEQEIKAIDERYWAFAEEVEQ